jgi:hypothetical protein
MPKKNKNGGRASGRSGNAKASSFQTSLLGGVADRARMKLKYVTVIPLTTITTTGAFSYVWRGNSVFDPDFTSSGGQPTNYDDWAGMYNQYRVWGSTFSVKPITTLSGTEPTLYAVGPRHISSSITFASQSDFISEPYVKANATSIYRSGAPDSHFFCSMSTPKFQGLTHDEFKGRDDLTALVSANPTEVWFWHWSVTNIDPTVTSEIGGLVEIVYDVEFFDRVDTGLDSLLQRRLSMPRPVQGRTYPHMKGVVRSTGEMKRPERRDEKKQLSVNADLSPAMSEPDSEDLEIVPAIPSVRENKAHGALISRPKLVRSGRQE